MRDRPHLTDAANTLFPCVLALRSLGFVVTRTESARGEDWHALRDDISLTAEDPIRLLGLATLWRDRGADWRATDKEIEQLLLEYVPGPHDNP